jgi:hypothetical protein
MSTTIKRISLVAVAALGLGVLSVAPSTAANQGDTLVLSSTTATQETGDTATATSATATLSFLASAAGDSMSVTASLTSFPAGNTVLPKFDLVETSTGTIAANTASGASQAAGPLTGLVQYASATAAGTTTAKYKVYLAGPTVVGTYVIRLTPAVVAGGGTLNASAQTLTITVTQKASSDTTVSAAASTSILNAGETNTATADATVTGTKTFTAGSNNVAAGTIAVTLKNAAGTTLNTESYTAQVLSGPGLLGSAAMAGAANNGSTATGRAITVRNGDVVGIFPDGASGVSKIEIRTAAGVLIGTETVTFFGDIASIVTTVVKPVIGQTATTGAVTAKAYDAAGTLVSTGNLYLVSGDTTVFATSGAVAITDGVATFDLTGLKAGSTTATVSNAATDATVKAAAASVRVGSIVPASVTVTTDKASYAPGEAAVISVVLLDASGLTVADGVYNNIFKTGGIAGNYTIGSLTDTTTVTIASGKGDRTVYLPVTEGDVKLSWTTGTNLATANQGVAGSVTVSVGSASTSAAIDAANEAAQAASDATDAALAAADAADAATTKAQEAVDAVATLSAQVSKLITALKAQITTLTNLVIKIQKKVKA